MTVAFAVYSGICHVRVWSAESLKAFTSTFGGALLGFGLLLKFEPWSGFLYFENIVSR